MTRSSSSRRDDRSRTGFATVPSGSNARAADHLPGRLGEVAELLRQFDPGALLQIAGEAQDHLVEDLDMPLVELGLLVDEQTGQAPQGVDPARGILARDGLFDLVHKGRHAGHSGVRPPNSTSGTLRAKRQRSVACLHARRGKALYFRCQLWFAAHAAVREWAPPGPLFFVVRRQSSLGKRWRTSATSV